MFWMILYTIDKPSPVPSPSVVKNGSNIFCFTLSVIPIPESLILISSFQVFVDGDRPPRWLFFRFDGLYAVTQNIHETWFSLPGKHSIFPFAAKFTTLICSGMIFSGYQCGLKSFINRFDLTLIQPAEAGATP